MTVCIAARSNQTIIAVSDRMLTSGDIQFEPTTTPKILSVSNSIAIMQSGDAAFNTEIIRELVPIVADRIAKSPSEWWQVKDVADLYVQYRNTAKRKRAEAALLTPLGLTIENYRDHISKFGDGVAETLVRDIINFDLPHTAVIVTGLDPYGPHIYVIHDGNIACHDVVGFGAVGIGARHAESQFMLAKHAFDSPLVDTALLAFIAKKRSEIAPGVGEATDMFTIGPSPGTLTAIAPSAVDNFDRIFVSLRGKEEKIRDEARNEANDFITKAAANAAERAKGQQEPTLDGEVTSAEKSNDSQ